MVARRRRFKPPRKHEFEDALAGHGFSWNVPPGWKQYAIDIDTEVEGALIRISSTIDVRDDDARELGANAIDVVVVDEETGAFVVDKQARVMAASKVLRTNGWPQRVRARVDELTGRVEEDTLLCGHCGGPMIFRRGVLACSMCPNEISETCDSCGAAMKIRHTKDDGRAFWGCSGYPDCRAGKDWGGQHRAPQAPPDDEEEEPQDTGTAPPGVSAAEIAAARSILEHELIRDSATAKKLLDLLDSDPDKAVAFTIGDETPSGKPTVQKILRAKLDSRKKPRKKAKPDKVRERELPENPLDGVRVYNSRERPDQPFYEITIPVEGGDDADAEDYPHHVLSHPTLNCVQARVLPWVEQDVNMVVATRTGTGKTTVAEMVMGDALARGAKAIFLSPLRAVSKEKYDDWTAEGHAWSSEYQTSIVTGDYSLTEKRKQELRRSDVIVMTSEMLDSKTRRIHNEGNGWLLRTLAIVVDEAHLLTMPGRGDALECGLMRFTKQNPNARVVLLSATMPNVDQLGRWLTHLNGKPTVVIQSQWRPTPLRVHYPTYDARGSYHVKEGRKREAMLDLLRQHRQDKWLVFVHSKKAGRKLLDEIQEFGERAEFHSADLDRDQRVSLEHRFKHGDLRICVATSTLAWGINMPARRVGVLGIHRGMEEVDPIDVKQECGRAGRPGFDPAGDAYVLLPDEGYPPKVARIRRRYEQVDPIESKLNNEDTLAFHLTAEISEGDVETVEDAIDWHERSLAAFQGRKLTSADQPDVAEIMLRLVRAGILQQEGSAPNVRYKATKLGRVSSWLYFSPFDVSDWCSNFRRISERDRERDDACVAFALGAVKTAYENSWLPRECERDMADLEFELRDAGVEFRRLPPVVLAFKKILEGRMNDKSMISLVRTAQRDSERILQAIDLIDRYVLNRLGRDYTTLLGARLRYGVSWTEADLCRLPGIGAKRAHKLVKEGIRGVDEFLEKKYDVVSIIGKRLAIPALRAAKEILRGPKKRRLQSR